MAYGGSCTTVGERHNLSQQIEAWPCGGASCGYQRLKLVPRYCNKNSIALWALFMFHRYVYNLHVVYTSGLNYLVKAHGVPRWNWVRTCPPVSLAKASPRLAKASRSLLEVVYFDDMKSK